MLRLREHALGLLAEEFRRSPSDWRQAGGSSRTLPSRLGGGREEAGTGEGMRVPTEEAEMRVDIKGVAPPLACLFPSPAAVARGGERAVLRRPRGCLVFPRPGASALAWPLPLPGLCGRPPSPPPEVAAASHVLSPCIPRLSSARRLGSPCALRVPLPAGFPVTPLPLLRGWGRVARRRPAAPSDSLPCRSSRSRRHVRPPAVDGRAELLQLPDQEEQADLQHCKWGSGPGPGADAPRRPASRPRCAPLPRSPTT